MRRTDEYGFEMGEADIQMLEALVKSPSFGALKRLFDRHRQQCFSVLTSASDTQVIFQTQGKIIGINTLENLPQILVAQAQAKQKKKTQEDELKKKTSKS